MYVDWSTDIIYTTYRIIQAVNDRLFLHIKQISPHPWTVSGKRWNFQKFRSGTHHDESCVPKTFANDWLYYFCNAWKRNDFENCNVL